MMKSGFGSATIQGATGLFVHPKGFLKVVEEIVQKIRCLINL